ncbi:MAG: hypothetical protein Q8P68_01450 [Candidatus Peregrinibacteria bacterium]|nr:hypothetical protein [Candidatus Peregrinibacteria bacterium]MDZ4244298.1 hypothetical protein [Candidatus Gracilibacteria bacterium]
MKNITTTIRLLLISTMLVLTLGIGTIYAAEVSETMTDDVVDEPVAQVDCFNGKENFASFLRSLISFGEFDAFFKDIQMNACQYTAVRQLKDDLENLREKIRDSYYMCDNKSANNLRLEYNHKEAELFFLRNLISTKKNERVATDLSSLKTKMFNKYVKQKKYFVEIAPANESTEEASDTQTVETFEEVWRDISKKYDAKTYLECKGDFELMRDKIEGLRDTIDGIVAEFKKDKEELDAEVEKLNDNGGNKNASEAELKLNAMSIFARSINQVSPQKFADEIIREFQSNSISQAELAAHIAEDQRRYEMDLARATKLARYRAKYQHTTDAISSDYEERIQTLISTIDSATINLDTTKDCLDFVNETQCSE